MSYWCYIELWGFQRRGDRWEKLKSHSVCVDPFVMLRFLILFLWHEIFQLPFFLYRSIRLGVFLSGPLGFSQHTAQICKAVENRCTSKFVRSCCCWYFSYMWLLFTFKIFLQPKGSWLSCINGNKIDYCSFYFSFYNFLYYFL